jgi:hypothetical protein
MPSDKQREKPADVGTGSNDTDANEEKRPHPEKDWGNRKSDLGLNENPAQHGTGRDDPSDTRRCCQLRRRCGWLE